MILITRQFLNDISTSQKALSIITDCVSIENSTIADSYLSRLSTIDMDDAMSYKPNDADSKLVWFVVTYKITNKITLRVVFAVNRKDYVMSCKLVIESYHKQVYEKSYDIYKRYTSIGKMEESDIELKCFIHSVLANVDLSEGNCLAGFKREITVGPDPFNMLTLKIFKHPLEYEYFTQNDDVIISTGTSTNNRHTTLFPDINTFAKGLIENDLDNIEDVLLEIFDEDDYYN